MRSKCVLNKNTNPDLRTQIHKFIKNKNKNNPVISNYQRSEIWERKGKMSSDQNEGTSYQPSKPMLCADNSAATVNLCSKRYRDYHMKEEHATLAVSVNLKAITFTVGTSYTLMSLVTVPTTTAILPSYKPNQKIHINPKCRTRVVWCIWTGENWLSFFRYKITIN